MTSLVMLPVGMPSFIGYSAHFSPNNNTKSHGNLPQSLSPIQPLHPSIMSSSPPNPTAISSSPLSSLMPTTQTSTNANTKPSDAPFFIHIPNAIKGTPSKLPNLTSIAEVCPPTTPVTISPYVVKPLPTSRTAQTVPSSLPLVLAASTIAASATPIASLASGESATAASTISNKISQSQSIPCSTVTFSSSSKSISVIPTASVLLSSSSAQPRRGSFQPIKPISVYSTSSAAKPLYSTPNTNPTESQNTNLALSSSTTFDANFHATNASYYFPPIANAVPMNVCQFTVGTPSPHSTPVGSSTQLAHATTKPDSPTAIRLPVTSATAAITNICNPLSTSIHPRYPNFTASGNNNALCINGSPNVGVYMVNQAESVVPATNAIVSATPIQTASPNMNIHIATLANSVSQAYISQYSMSNVYEPVAMADSEDVLCPPLQALHPSFSQPHVDGLSSSRLITHISKKPTKVLEYRVMRSAIPGTQLGIDHNGVDEEISVRIRVMGGEFPIYPSSATGPVVPSRQHLLFVAADISQLIHCRKSNIAKAVSLFNEHEKARMPIECPRSNGTLSTHILTALTWAGVCHLLTSSRAPIAQPFFKWLTVQVDDLIDELTRRRTNKRRMDSSEDEEMISPAVGNTRRRYSESSGYSTTSSSPTSRGS